MDKPTKAHLSYAKDVLRYLKGTISQKLTFHASKEPLNLIGYTDSDYAGSDDRKSSSGYCFKLSDESGLISWKTKKQDVVALSSCEAEYIALSYAVQEGKFLQQVAADMQHKPLSEFDLFCDNQGALKLAGNQIHQQRSKHIDVKYHFVRSEVEKGNVRLDYVPTSANIADMFTKPLPRIKMNMFNYSG